MELTGLTQNVTALNHPHTHALSQEVRLPHSVTTQMRTNIENRECEVVVFFTPKFLCFHFSTLLPETGQ
jgi:hypothetical protein